MFEKFCFREKKALWHKIGNRRSLPQSFERLSLPDPLELVDEILSAWFGLSHDGAVS